MAHPPGSCKVIALTTRRPASARTLAPFWVPPERGLAFPRTRLAGRVDVDVAVVGSGLTASLSAALLAREGLAVALVTTDAIGDDSACGLGIVGSIPAASAVETRSAHGVRATRAIWSATRAAGTDLVSMLARWKAPCGLGRLPSYLVASDDGPAAALEREHAALEACGSEATWLGPARVMATLGLERAVGLRLADADGVVDPVRATLACARAATAARAIVVERLAIDRIVRTRLGVEVHAGRHVLGAATCVVATTVLPDEYRAFRRHLAETTVVTCALPALPAAVRKRLGRPAICEAVGMPGLAWRPVPDGRLVLTRHIPVALEHTDMRTVLGATGELMYDFTLQHPLVSGEQPAARWLRPVTAGIDGLPVAGRHRAFPRHVFALARADRLAECALAARVATSAVMERAHAASGWLDVSRVR